MNITNLITNDDSRDDRSLISIAKMNTFRLTNSSINITYNGIPTLTSLVQLAHATSNGWVGGAKKQQHFYTHLIP